MLWSLRSDNIEMELSYVWLVPILITLNFFFGHEIVHYHIAILNGYVEREKIPQKSTEQNCGDLIECAYWKFVFGIFQSYLFDFWFQVNREPWNVCYLIRGTSGYLNRNEALGLFVIP